jgi:hypothetical protein
MTEASIAHRELYEVVPGGGANAIALADPATYYGWETAVDGVSDRSGLVAFEQKSRDTWNAVATYLAGARVRYDGHDWAALVDVPANQEPGTAQYDSDGQGTMLDYWDDLGERAADRLVVGAGARGVYHVTASITFDGTADTLFTWCVHVNDGAVVKLRAAAKPGAAPQTIVISGLVQLEDGDFLDLRVKAGAGDDSAVNLDQVNLTLVRISP